MKGQRARELNETIRYTMWSVFRLREPLGDADRAGEAGEVEELFAQLAGKDVVVRGTYDLSGLRADADVLVWWHAPTSDALQEAYSALRRTAFGQRLDPVWSQLALHRPAEFNKSHLPAFVAGEEPGGVPLPVPVRPVLRLVPAARRRAPRRCWPTTVAWPHAGTPTSARTPSPAFALGDYEWLLAFEAPELHRIVDLMRRPARLDRGAPPRPRGGAVLHRPAPPGRRPARHGGLTAVGLLDRFKRSDGVEVEPAPTVVLDTTTRVRQLLVLADSLDDLAAAMRGDAAQRYNPGWAGRIDEYTAAAERARTLRREGFTLDDLLDLAAEVRPLFVRGQGVAPDPAMLALEPQQDAVMAGVAALRVAAPGETEA